MSPFISNAYAQSQQAASGGGGLLSMLGQMAPMLLFLAAAFFLFVQPQMRRQKEAQKILDSVATGDEVTTVSGIFGKVVGVKDQTLTLKIAKEVEITVEKSAVKQILPKGTVRF